MATLRGLAIVTDSLSQNLGGFVERITRRAVQNALGRSRDIIALADHDSSKVLARVSAGTMHLDLTSRGLEVTLALPESAIGEHVAVSVGRGDTRGMSFSFSVPPGGDTFDEENGQLVRTVNDMHLYEVSVCVWPAYEATSVELIKRQQKTAGSETRAAAETERLRLQSEWLSLQ